MKDGKPTTTRGRMFILAFCIFNIILATASTILIVNAEENEITWGDIKEADFHVMNKNIWMIKKTFTTNFTSMDVIAIQFNVSETPPSYMARLSLHQGEDEIFVNQRVNITQDEWDNHTWKIVFITGGLNATPQVDYDINVKIQKSHQTLNPEDSEPLEEPPMFFRIGIIGGETPLPEPTPDPGNSPAAPSGSGGINTNPLPLMDASGTQDDLPTLWHPSELLIIGFILVLMGIMRIKIYNIPPFLLVVAGILIVLIDGVRFG